ncbi:MAG: hypothetical protein KDD04_09455, partial [Sinomicrobium sp.]|nr:hypothetical protein [Sinomicrobium sp.]
FVIKSKDTSKYGKTMNFVFKTSFAIIYCAFATIYLFCYLDVAMAATIQKMEKYFFTGAFLRGRALR